MCLQKKNRNQMIEVEVEELNDYTTGAVSSLKHETEKLEKSKKELVFNLENTFGADLEEGIDAKSAKFSGEVSQTENQTSENTNMLVNYGIFNQMHSNSSRNLNPDLCVAKTGTSGILFTVKSMNHDELPEKAFCMNNIVILDSEISQARKLIVEDEVGDLLFNYLLVIDASGLTNSLRKQRDGYVFFGPSSEYKDCIVNDYVINYEDDLCNTRLFVIFYQRNEQKYYIRSINDSESNFFMYIKITSNYQIRKRQYFSINQIAFSIEPESNMHTVENNSSPSSSVHHSIKLTLYEGNERKKGSETYRFNESDSPVRIGRSKCTISFDYSFLSKRHCEIVFNKDEDVWEINDGYKGKASTNGTWMLLKSKFEICDTTFVKVGANVIKINVV